MTAKYHEVVASIAITGAGDAIEAKMVMRDGKARLDLVANGETIETTDKEAARVVLRAVNAAMLALNKALDLAIKNAPEGRDA